MDDGHLHGLSSRMGREVAALRRTHTTSERHYETDQAFHTVVALVVSVSALSACAPMMGGGAPMNSSPPMVGWAAMYPTKT